jgi:hypothetical protein
MGAEVHLKFETWTYKDDGPGPIQPFIFIFFGDIVAGALGQILSLSQKCCG